MLHYVQLEHICWRSSVPTSALIKEHFLWKTNFLVTFEGKSKNIYVVFTKYKICRVDWGWNIQQESKNSKKKTPFHYFRFMFLCKHKFIRACNQYHGPRQCLPLPDSMSEHLRWHSQNNFKKHFCIVQYIKDRSLWVSGNKSFMKYMCTFTLKSIKLTKSHFNPQSRVFFWTIE